MHINEFTDERLGYSSMNNIVMNKSNHMKSLQQMNNSAYDVFNGAGNLSLASPSSIRDSEKSASKIMIRVEKKVNSPFSNTQIREKTENNSENNDYMPLEASQNENLLQSEMPNSKNARNLLNDKLVNGHLTVSILKSEQDPSSLNAGYVNNFGALNPKKTLMARKSEMHSLNQMNANNNRACSIQTNNNQSESNHLTSVVGPQIMPSISVESNEL